MKIISVDHLPLSRNPLIANDYISIYIYSAIMDPLFIMHGGQLKKHACSKVLCVKQKKYIIEIRNDLKYYNGESVTVDDFYNTFINIMKSTERTFAKLLLKNIKDISIVDDKLIFVLRKKDKFFLNKLSFYAFSPLKSDLSCGPYYIVQNNDDAYLLKRNKYYRYGLNNIKLDTLKFVKFLDNFQDICSFNDKKINMTNDTTFPIEYIASQTPYIELSNLFIMLKFNKKKLSNNFKKLRRIISNVIDKEKINKKMNEIYIVKNDFNLYFTEKTKVNKITEKKNNKKIILTLGYTNYYPNYLLATEIKKQLIKYNIYIKLEEYKLCASNDYDMYLDIDYSPFNYNEYFYLSTYFRIINGKYYNKLCDLYESTRSRIIYALIVHYSKSNFKAIPLFKMKYIFLCDDDLKEYNHLEMNYWQL